TENLIAVDDTEFSHDEMENLVAVDEPEQAENLVAADEGQNGSIENSDLDDVYQAFSNQVNSK
ncbi:hypothetical protein NVT87_15380, partial [Acinetobacter radioresistens]